MLNNILEENNITLNFVEHHAMTMNNKINFINYNINSSMINIIHPTEISKCIKEASCLITDFSSVAFDFMFQNKPVIYYMLDAQSQNLSKFDKEDIVKFEYKKYILQNVFYNEDEIIDKLHFINRKA